MLYRVEKYAAVHFEVWNDLISRSKNGTFLFNRGFMEYHEDRFEDYSLLVFNDDKAIAALPAHIAGSELFSHSGLTYGGLVYDEKVKLAEVITVFGAILKFLHEQDITRLHLKTIPAIYHKYPSDELHYALFLVNAILTRRDSLSVVDRGNELTITKTRKEAIRRGAKNGLVIREEPEFKNFWNEILIPNLWKKHKAKPVHTLNEMQLLHSRFPDNIRHFNVYKDGKLVAGTTMFVTDTVAHPQYISGQEDKNQLGSLDFLYNYLLDLFSEKKYFDFGPSNEEQGRKLNSGIVFWKESFGARTIVQDFYEVETCNHELLNNAII